MTQQIAKLIKHDLSDIQTIGIPRAFLYYRYGCLWTSFFEGLGRKVVVSQTTDKAVVDAGMQLSIDECCLASKAYMGHVKSLLGKCDAIFVPSYGSIDPRSGFCTKFQSLPDLVANTFRDQDIRVVSLLVENVIDKKETRRAFFELALRLGTSLKIAKHAWKQAVCAQEDKDAACAHAMEERLRLLDEYRHVMEKDTNTRRLPLGILLAAHPYIAHDRYMCGTIIDTLEAMEANIIYADEINHAKAHKASFEFSRTLPWIINRELIGSLLLLGDKIDGVVLISAFPCGPDSMTDDAVMRCIQGKPILNLMIDEQSGTAGIQTRIESFIDILRFQQKGGYIDD